MRNLNEYKEEIFRRGQNRITARRVAVKRVVSFCIPLCLTLVVCSAAVLPQLFNGNNFKEDAENASPETTSDKYDAYYDSSYGNIPTIDDENRSEEVNDSLDESKDSPDESKDSPDESNDGYDCSAEVGLETSADTSEGELGPNDVLVDDEIQENPNPSPPDNDGNDSAFESVDFSFSLVWNCYGVSSYDSATGVLVKTTDATNPEDYVATLTLSPSEIATVYKLLNNLNANEYPDIYSPHPDNFMSDPPMTLILTVNIGEMTKTISAKDIAYSFASNDPEGQRFLTTCKQIIDILTSTDEWKELPEYEHLYA